MTASSRVLSPEEPVALVQDLSWGFRSQGPDGRITNPAVRLVWREVHERRLTGYLFVPNEGGIDGYLVVEGSIVGILGTPYGGDYFLVRLGEQGDYDHAFTIQEAIDYYRGLPMVRGDGDATLPGGIGCPRCNSLWATADSVRAHVAERHPYALAEVS